MCVALRAAVARLYNETYRVGKASQYTHENVCIVPGGRAGLSRLAAVVGDVYCAYQARHCHVCGQALSKSTHSGTRLYSLPAGKSTWAPP